LISVPSFQRDFRVEYDGSYIISSQWQIFFNTAASIGGLVGCLITGYVADRLELGRQPIIGLACMISIGGVLIQVFTLLQSVLLVSKLVNGLSLSTSLALPSLFLSEISPIAICGVATSTIQFFLSFSQLMANLVLKGTGTMETNLAYRIPFVLQFLFPSILPIRLPFCPEPPWLLLRTNKVERATSALIRLGYADPEQKTLTTMAKTLAHEAELTTSTTYISCLRGPDLRRTEIGCGFFAVCQFTGVVFVIGYGS
jgi:SP family general alpha glucoside:H+ symporter-like MFS transporter